MLSLGEDPPVEQQEVPGGGTLGRRDGTSHIVDVPDADCRPEQRLIDNQPTHADEGEPAEEQGPQGCPFGAESLAAATMQSGDFTREEAGRNSAALSTYLC